MYQPKATTKKKLMDLSSVLGFGKWKEYTIKEVLEYDPEYIDWCVYKEIFDITSDVADELEVSILDSQYPEI